MKNPGPLTYDISRRLAVIKQSSDNPCKEGTTVKEILEAHYKFLDPELLAMLDERIKLGKELYNTELYTGTKETPWHRSPAIDYLQEVLDSAQYAAQQVGICLARDQRTKANIWHKRVLLQCAEALSCIKEFKMGFTKKDK